MRFRFCGGLDCPDWVLAEITILARMSSIKMKLLTSQVVKSLLGEELDSEKVKKYTSDAKYDSSDLKAALAVLTFILSSAARYDVESPTLENELQQLGLPKEHSVALCKVFSDSNKKLQDHLRLETLKASSIVKFEGKVRHELDPSGENVLPDPYVDLDLVVTTADSGKTEELTLTMTSAKFQVFLHEMKQARDALQQAASSLQS